MCNESCILQDFARAWRAPLTIDKKLLKGAVGLPPFLIEMPRPTSFGKDTGLQVRMTFTMFLLGALYVALVVALLYSGVSGVTVALIAGGLAALNFFASDKL